MKLKLADKRNTTQTSTKQKWPHCNETHSKRRREKNTSELHKHSIFTQNTNDMWLTQRQLMFRASNLELEWGITWCRELPMSSWKCPESASCPDFINFTSTRKSSFKSNPKMNNSGLKEGWSLAGGSVTWKYDGNGFKKGQWSQQRGVPWSGVHYMEIWRERFRKGERTYTHACVRARTHTHTHPTPHTSSKLWCSKDLSAVLSEHGNDGLHTDKNLQ